MWATRSHYTTTIVKNYRNSSNCDDSHFQVRTSLRKSDPTSESRAPYYYFKAGEGPRISQAEVRILDHRIEINQMSIKCPTLVKPPFFFSRNAHVRKYTINTPYWRHPGKFPRHFWPLSDICRLRRLTFCMYLARYLGRGFELSHLDVNRLLYTKKASGKKLPGELRERFARRHLGDMRENINFKGADIELDFWSISILWPWSTHILLPPALASVIRHWLKSWGSNLIVGLF